MITTGWRRDRVGRAGRRAADLLLDDVLELMSDAVVVADGSGTVVAVNQVALDLFGYTEPELVGSPVEALVPERHRAAHRELLAEYQTKGPTARHIGVRPSVRARRRDGSEFTARVSLAPVGLAATGVTATTGVAGRVLAIVTDLSDVERELQARSANDARYRLLFEHAAEGIVELADDGTVAAANPAALRMFGATTDRIDALAAALHTVAQRGHVEGWPGGGSGGAAGGSGGGAAGSSIGSIRHEVELRRLDGSAFWGSVTVQPGLTDSGEASGLRIRLVDVTARVAAERELRESETRFKAVLDHSTSGVLVVGEGRRLLYANATAAEMLPLEDWDGELDLEMLATTLHPEDREPVDRAVASLTSSPDRRASFECRLVRPDGRTVSVETSVVDLRHDPLVRGWFVQTLDVTEQRRNQRALAYTASHDLLTGLANRSYLEQRLQRIAIEPADDEAIGVVFIDIDHFKYTNESLGHAFGDQVLRVISARLVRHVRDADIIARFGGDEFVIVWRFSEPPGDPTTDQANGGGRLAELGAVAEHLRRVIAEPMELDAVSTTVTASIGVATIRSIECDPSLLLGDADAALHLAKQRGRDQVARFDVDLRRRVAHRRSLEQALRAAVERDQLAVHYQPIVRLDDLVVIGREALVRWQPTDGPMIEPLQFLGLAEETGLIVDLGRAVLRTACRDLARWQRAAAEAGAAAQLSPYVAVNVSPRQLLVADFAHEVAVQCADAGADPSGLVIEITEHRGLADPDGARVHLRALRELGVRIAVDDFGTGYSSLAQLADMPVDVVKIDQSFVARLVDDGPARRGAAMIEAIVAMAGALGFDVIAEGVEHQHQLHRLREAGCSSGQGWLFGRPAPLDGAPLDGSRVDGPQVDRSQVE